MFSACERSPNAGLKSDHMCSSGTALPPAQRLLFDIVSWNPSPEAFSFLNGLLTQEEAAHVLKFMRYEDRKRALISRLLQRYCISGVLAQDFRELSISRTKGKKPFANSRQDREDAPNFNFNVSHEGDYVALASEPICIVGIDIAAPNQLRPTGKQRNVQESLALMRDVWSDAEAFTKARGDGVGFSPMSRAHFTFGHRADPTDCGSDPWASVAHVTIDGVPQTRWRFFLEALPNNHWVTVALGPPSCVIDAHGIFKSLLSKPDLSDTEIEEALSGLPPPFKALSITDIIPGDAVAQYRQLSL